MGRGVELEIEIEGVLLGMSKASGRDIVGVEMGMGIVILTSGSSAESVDGTMTKVPVGTTTSIKGEEFMRVAVGMPIVMLVLSDAADGSGSRENVVFGHLTTRVVLMMPTEIPDGPDASKD